MMAVATIRTILNGNPDGNISFTGFEWYATVI